MGKTSKALHIVLDQSLYDAIKDEWVALQEQGHNIEVVTGTIPDLYIAPFACRMTADMLTAMPSALKLAITGARNLRYAPHGTGAVKGKSKGVQNKATRKRKDDSQSTQTVIDGASGAITGNSTTTEQVERVGGSTNYTASETTNDERVS